MGELSRKEGPGFSPLPLAALSWGSRGSQAGHAGSWRAEDRRLVPALGYSECDSTGPLSMHRAHCRLQSALCVGQAKYQVLVPLRFTLAGARSEIPAAAANLAEWLSRSLPFCKTRLSPPLRDASCPPKRVGVPFAVLMPFAWPETETTYPWVVYGSSGAGVIAPWSLSRRLFVSPPRSTIWIRLHPTSWAAMVHTVPFNPGASRCWDQFPQFLTNMSSWDF